MDIAMHSAQRELYNLFRTDEILTLDHFSMMDICQPFEVEPPKEALFDPKKTAIIGNGRCASSCSLFSVRLTLQHLVVRD